MKKLIFAFLFLSVLLASCKAAALEIPDYNITFEVMPDTRVMETVSMTFAEALNASTLNYVVLGEISDLVISDGVKNIDYVLEKSGSEHNVKLVVPEGTEKLVIKFTAKDLVFSSESTYSFSANLKPPASKSVNIKAFLPRGFAVYRNVVYPAGYETLTDGERIYLKWTFSNPDDIMISFKFYNTHSDYSLAIMIVMGLIILGVAVYLVAYYRKKVLCCIISVSFLR